MKGLDMGQTLTLEGTDEMDVFKIIAGDDDDDKSPVKPEAVTSQCKFFHLFLSYFVKNYMKKI